MSDELKRPEVTGEEVLRLHTCCYSDEELDAEFNAIRAKALTDLADQMRDRFTAAWIRGKAREYTHGPHKPVGAFAISENNQEADCGDQGL